LCDFIYVSALLPLPAACCFLPDDGASQCRVDRPEDAWSQRNEKVHSRDVAHGYCNHLVSHHPIATRLGETCSFVAHLSSAVWMRNLLRTFFPSLSSKVSPFSNCPFEGGPRWWLGLDVMLSILTSSSSLAEIGVLCARLKSREKAWREGKTRSK